MPERHLTLDAQKPLHQTFLKFSRVMQDVERECAAACASLAMPMPLNVSLRREDLAQLQQRLLALLMQPDPAVPFTPSLKVFQISPSRQLTGTPQQAAQPLFSDLAWLSRPNPGE